MDHTENTLTPGKYYPKNIPAPDARDILALLGEYGHKAEGRVSLIDTSHSEKDVRLNYIVDRKWVLRLCIAPEMTEKRMLDLNRLIARYNDFGLRCPRFLTDADGRFFHAWNGLICYLAEYIDLPLLQDMSREDIDAIWPEVADSVAAFAERYKNVDLIDTMGMYSLFDLSPFDIEAGRDEKQQNCDMLIGALRDIGEDELAARLEKKHEKIRGKLRAVYRELPRCVFQADENIGNVLVGEDKHLAGFIDFNLAGTEVIVNQLVNLGGGFTEFGEEPIGASVRLEKRLAADRTTLERMLSIYHASELEKKAAEWYGWIALTFGWPQVCFFLDGLKNEKMKDEILGILALLAEQEDEDEACLIRRERRRAVPSSCVQRGSHEDEPRQGFYR
ncbi:MAG: phosphotransferase [Clostridia bacterium]|nr:phosphotransferase [Clostridia bacterium]